MPQQAVARVRRLDLKVGDYNVDGASIGCGPQGSKFACTIGPLSDATVGALEGAARNHDRICLLLPEPLLLDVVLLERKEAQRVRIVGRIVDPFSLSDW